VKVVFRADASLEIGSGHVMRCLTLAHALRERGAECRFVCRNHQGNLLALIRNQGFDVQTLLKKGGESLAPADTNEQHLAHASWLEGTWRDDAEATREVLGDTCIDWLIVDHYALDARWESALRPLCRKILVIDDLADRMHDCDLLLDQNLVANMANRYRGKVPDQCGLLSGPDYALLQSEYAKLHFCALPRKGLVRQVLVYFGGADSDNMTGMAIAAFLSLGREDVSLDVVINPESAHAEAIRSQVEGRSQITLHAQLPTLAQLMAKADLAIGAGGATTWERCCLGLPAIVVTLADNQRPATKELNQQGLVRWLGHKDEVSESMLTLYLGNILDEGLLSACSEKCWQLVDGLGASRVSEFIMLNTETPLVARLACLDDETLILGWANDPLVRNNSFNSGHIDPIAHHTWFCDRLRELDHCRFYVVETTDALPVGQVRFQKEGDAWEVHYALDARVRGRGVAKPLLKTALMAFQQSTDKAQVFGRVRGANAASSQVFEGLGFVSEKKGGDIVYHRSL